MGLYAEIFAIGKFSKDISPYLEYPDDSYKNTKMGTVITEVLFGISEGTSLSREFALLFGVDDVWDFEQHKIINDKINFDGLKKFTEKYDNYEDEYERLFKLNEYGFEFHFRQNG